MNQYEIPIETSKSPQNVRAIGRLEEPLACQWRPLVTTCLLLLLLLSSFSCTRNRGQEQGAAQVQQEARPPVTPAESKPEGAVRLIAAPDTAEITVSAHVIHKIIKKMGAKNALLRLNIVRNEI